MSPPVDPQAARLLRLESEMLALRRDVDGRLEAIQAELERRVSSSDASAVALSALTRRLDHLKEDWDGKLDRILEALGASDDTGGG